MVWLCVYYFSRYQLYGREPGGFGRGASNCGDVVSRDQRASTSGKLKKTRILVWVLQIYKGTRSLWLTPTGWLNYIFHLDIN
ncbi:hypothetical protein TWF788_010534 [Orbilia oligospora]|uniref:Uncharacterized protein n=1 Tax=Orbilia oligospora TaxID=2813651 RepID=A0A7C8Q286_ORBOL|nr:hypothetical protein TWF788_010534 [Orbilia oligospora]